MSCKIIQPPPKPQSPNLKPYIIGFRARDLGFRVYLLLLTTSGVPRGGFPTHLLVASHWKILEALMDAWQDRLGSCSGMYRDPLRVPSSDL